MRKIFLILATAVFMASCGSQAPKEPAINTLTAAEVADGWQLLFNGNDLNNWKIYNGGDVTGWKIVDGVLHNSGVGSDHGGDIITREQYQSFELYLEWMVDTASNSGIFFNVVENVAPALYQSGPEYQLIDDYNWPGELDAKQMSGANYDMHAPVGAEVLGLDEWNKTRLIVNGPKVQHWLNGVKVVEYELWSDDWYKRKDNSKWKNETFYGAATQGHIGLQDHGGLTMFRNIKIRKL
ncbi:MAG: 3-keto-disaccharide hydrolase [Bacteroidota bacterium]